MITALHLAVGHLRRRGGFGRLAKWYIVRLGGRGGAYRISELLELREDLRQRRRRAVRDGLHLDALAALAGSLDLALVTLHAQRNSLHARFC